MPGYYEDGEDAVVMNLPLEKEHSTLKNNS
jgi:hypothetical protein